MEGDRYELTTKRELSALRNLAQEVRQALSVHAKGKGEDFEISIVKVREAMKGVDRAERESKGDKR